MSRPDAKMECLRQAALTRIDPCRIARPAVMYHRIPEAFQ